MTNNIYIFIISCWLFLLEVYLGIASYASEEAIKILDETRLLPKTKGTIKTIECPEDGVVIDCIDFWQQPAFDNLITKKLQLMESTMRNPIDFGSRNESKMQRRYHKWNTYGDCPKDTIPIRRTQKTNDTIYHRKYSEDGVSNSDPHEYATIDSPRSIYHGSSAILNIWKPYALTGPGTDEMTLAQVWVTSQVGGRQNLNTLEAGWMRDNYQQTGCYNIRNDCPGFVVTGRTVTLDCDIDLTSNYEGDQYEVYINIERRTNGNWYLFMDNDVIGFWPENILTTLADRATRLAWGGEVSYEPIDGRHTTTHMGSGYFPSEGFKRAAYFREIKTIKNINNGWENLDADTLTVVVSQPNCYDLELGDSTNYMFHTHFFYGGPGGPYCNHP